MCLFLILYWCSWDGATAIPVIPGSADLIPDYAVINSRLALLREFARKHLIRLTLCAAKWRLPRQNRRNSRLDGNNRELRSHWNCGRFPGGGGLGLTAELEQVGRLLAPGTLAGKPPGHCDDVGSGGADHLELALG
jgi:hypothetical protein